MNEIISALNWRYATKAYDTDKKISDSDMETLLESLRLAPSSFGLQPWKFIVVKNPEMRTQLRAASWDQAQITDASHLVVIAARRTMDATEIDRFVAATAEARGTTSEALAGYADMMKGTVSSRTPEQLAGWNARQAYIALGFLLETAAMMKIDATPMEGFDPASYNELLGLTDTEFTAIVAVPLGNRLESDKYASAPKVRYDAGEVFVYID
jgi:nitroreductase